MNKRKTAITIGLSAVGVLALVLWGLAFGLRQMAAGVSTAAYEQREEQLAAVSDYTYDRAVTGTAAEYGAMPDISMVITEDYEGDLAGVIGLASDSSAAGSAGELGREAPLGETETVTVGPDKTLAYSLVATIQVEMIAAVGIVIAMAILVVIRLVRRKA